MERRARLQQEWQLLCRYSCALVRDEEHARDMAQEVAVRVLAATSVPADGFAFRRWIYQTLRNLAVDRWRKRRRDDALTDALDQLSPRDIWHFDDGVIAEITVRQALRTLPDQMRDIVALIDIAGFSYSDVAEIQGVPLGTVMSRISRARAALLAAIETSPVRTMPKRHVR